jgi:hypothetical protein
MDTVKLRQVIVWLVMWLTRLAGAIFVFFGLDCFVTAWQERAASLVVMGIITIAFGAVMLSIRIVSGHRLQYGLFRPRRRSS